MTRSNTFFSAAIAALSSLLTFSATAARITPTEALNRACDERFEIAGSNFRKNVRKGASMQLVSESSYVYSVKVGNEMLLLSADDNAPAVLGYFDNAEAQIAENPAFDWLMSEYDNQIEYLLNNDSLSEEDSYSSPRRGHGMTKAAIEPIVKTSWAQGYPFNSNCPELNGQKTKAGCVAITMAQIMHSQNWPAAASGNVGYYWNEGKSSLQFDFSSTSFNYSAMTLGYPADGSAATGGAADLIKACAMGAKAQFGIEATSATTKDMCLAMIRNFGYDSSAWIASGKHYSPSEWEDLIYSQLEQGIAVPLSGTGSKGGHQFITDGYNGNGLFHINWGWGGAYNGYFLLSVMDAAGYSFNINQEAVIGLKPATDNKNTYSVVTEKDIFTDQTLVQPGQSITFTGEFINASLFALPENNRMGIAFTSISDNSTVYSQGASAGVLGYRYYVKSWKASLPTLSDGHYVMQPAVLVDGEWSEVRAPYDGRTHYIIEVTSGVARIMDPAEFHIARSADPMTGEISGVASLIEDRNDSQAYDLQGRPATSSSRMVITNGRLSIRR